MRLPSLSFLVLFFVASQIGCTSDSLRKSVVQNESYFLGKDRFFVMNATNRFLSLLFEELENGIEQVLETSSLAKDQLMKPQALASEATMILKREVTQVINEAYQKYEEGGVFSKIVTVATAAVVAMSAYSYIV